jgi:hypothetical protein
MKNKKQNKNQTSFLSKKRQTSSNLGCQWMGLGLDLI